MNRKPIAAIITDTHMDEKNALVNISIFEQAVDVVKSLGLNVLYHAGDLFDSRKAQTQKNLNTLLSIMEYVQQNKIEMRVIPGNHDKTDYNSVLSFLGTYRKECRLISEYESFKINRDTYIHMIPFFSDEKYMEVLKCHVSEIFTNITDWHDNYHVLITHIGMNGAIMNNGTAIKSAINESLFNMFNKVLIGHYHNASEYSDRIRYIGSSIQHNFGETPNKGLTVLYSDMSIETIPLRFPKYLSFEVDVKDMTLKDIRDFKEAKEETGDQYRIILKGDKAKLKAYDKHQLQEAGIAVKVQEEKLVEEELEERVEPFTSLTLNSTFFQFCEKNNIDDYQVGKKYLTQVLN